MTGLRRVRHPGPAQVPRACVLPVQARPVTVTLRAGLTFLQAAAQALDGHDGAVLTLADVALDPLAYVIPGPAPGDGHAAWYSATHHMGPGATVIAGCAHLGWRDGAAFMHCHGVWTDARGARHMGHLLPDTARLAHDCTVTGWALSGGALVARPDPETRFTLLRPERGAPPSAAGAPAHLVTLRPNQDIGAALAATGLDGPVLGLGSLVGTALAGGTGLDSYATEILLTGGHVGAGTATLDAASIGLDGRMVTGRLAPGVNSVLITAELLVGPGTA